MFFLLAKIQIENPNLESAREMIHGNIDFRFNRIKELREKLETFPILSVTWIPLNEIWDFEEALTGMEQCGT